MDLTVKERVNRILEYYFSGSLPKDLEAEVLAWIMYDGHRKEKSAKLEEIWNNIVRYEARPADEEKIVRSINAVKKKLGLPPMGKQPPQAIRRRMGTGRKILMYAAIAAIPVMLLLGIGYLMNDRTAKTPVSEVHIAAADTQRFVTLPDGTQIWLSPDSALFYPEGFASERSVRLEGEAYFKVERDESKPFIVNTRMLAVTVLGTEFSVRANPYEDETEVILNSGKVEVNVEDANSSYILDRRERLIYRHEENKVIEETIPRGEPADMRAADFEQEKLEDVLRAVSGKYGIPIRCDHSAIAGETVTIKFLGNEPLDSVLTWLCEITGTLNYTIDNEGVIIK